MKNNTVKIQQSDNTEVSLGNSEKHLSSREKKQQMMLCFIFSLNQAQQWYRDTMDMCSNTAPKGFQDNPSP